MSNYTNHDVIIAAGLLHIANIISCSKPKIAYSTAVRNMGIDQTKFNEWAKVRFDMTGVRLATTIANGEKVEPINCPAPYGFFKLCTCDVVGEARITANTIKDMVLGNRQNNPLYDVVTVDSSVMVTNDSYTHILLRGDIGHEGRLYIRLPFAETFTEHLKRLDGPTVRNEDLVEASGINYAIAVRTMVNATATTIQRVKP